MTPYLLDISGAANILGGDDAVSAMTSVHVYRNRRWLGWYNTPGSLQIAKRLNLFAKSAHFHNVLSGKLSPASNPESVWTDPATLLRLDRCKGPRFCSAHSDTIIEKTGYLGTLFMDECAAWDSEGTMISGRRTLPIRITLANLGPAPATEMYPTHDGAPIPFSAGIPIISSIVTCVLCAVRKDWYASLLILVGVTARGISCLVLGSADFVFTHLESTKSSLAGDGVLTFDKDIAVLKGTEGAVNAITRGRFYLRFSNEGHHNLIRMCAVLLFIQAITQFLLIPEASLFGQLMFLTSMVISAVYNASLSSSDKEQIHRKIVLKKILQNPILTKYTLGTRTAAVVFILLILQPSDPTRLLDELLPGNTKVWKQWKATILEWLRYPNEESFPLGGDLRGFTQQDRDLLELLFEDARAAYNGYRDHLQV